METAIPHLLTQATRWVMVSVAVLSALATAQWSRASDMEIIFAKAQWYLERAEPEQTLTGVLEENDPQVGPAARTSLSYRLRTGSTPLPVYAAGIENTLAEYARQQVRVRGKIIDLSDEGFSSELWIGSISTTSDQED